MQINANPTDFKDISDSFWIAIANIWKAINSTWMIRGSYFLFTFAASNKTNDWDEKIFIDFYYADCVDVCSS